MMVAWLGANLVRVPGSLFWADITGWPVDLKYFVRIIASIYLDQQMHIHNDNIICLNLTQIMKFAMFWWNLQ